MKIVFVVLCPYHANWLSNNALFIKENTIFEQKYYVTKVQVTFMYH